MRAFIVLALWHLLLVAYEYNNMLLKFQASIYPKLILFDKNVAKNIPDKRVDFCIVCERVDLFSAEFMQEKIYKNYPFGLHGFKFIVEILNINQFLSDKSVVKNIDALYVMKLKEGDIKKVATLIKRKNIYSFTYAKEDLFYGFLFNVALEKDVEIFLNKKVLLQNRFEFIDTLYRIVKIVE